MESQQEDSFKVKTHDEIMRLFKDLEVVETRVKNLEHCKEELLKPEPFEQTQPTFHIPEQAVEDQPPLQPASEIPQKQIERHRKKFWERKQQQDGDTREKIQRFSFLKREIPHQSDLTPTIETTEGEPQEQPARSPRSTFVLQLDPSGNLVGLPVKKPKPETGKRAGFFSKKTDQEGSQGNQEGEPVKGIKGKLKQLGSLFKRNTSQEAEPSEGVGAKIKGIFRRRSKE